MNSGTCVAKYEDDEYHCACAEGFLGKYCEEKGILTSVSYIVCKSGLACEKKKEET